MQLADRVRATLAAAPSMREVPMFGGVSFMVNDKMVVSARSDGDLLVRADPKRASELVAFHGARPAKMGAGRAMGPGWIAVAEKAITTDERLSFWIAAALEYTVGQGHSRGE